MKTTLTPSQLRELLHYDADTGALTWRQRAADWFSSPVACARWNTRHAGRPAVSVLSASGYLVGSVADEKFMAHRVAWAVYYGRWPEHTIDHINGNRSDNRIANLRDVPEAINRRNTKRGKVSSSGVNGVYFDKARGKWMAYITAGGPMKNIGRFNCLTAAAIARKRAEQGLGFTTRHGV